MYLEGNGVPVDKQRGKQYFEQAAAAGDAKAADTLGLMYMRGKSQWPGWLALRRW